MSERALKLMEAISRIDDQYLDLADKTKEEIMKMSNL